MSTVAKTRWTPAERRNWGYWDGRAARSRNRYPVWARSHLYRGQHPFDQCYGTAFWAGWYGEAHPNTGKVEI